MNIQPKVIHQKVDRDLNAVSDIAMQVKDFAATILDENSAAAVELAFVEALTNAIKHGSIRGRAHGQITVTARADDQSFVVELVDTLPMVPQERLDRAKLQPFPLDIDNIASLEEDGRGLSIMVLAMDEVTLHTANDQYVLSMVKYINH
ncbi:MAG: ATP-binding protein [Loktanella sp.]|nr:ATP-binding protein [Loktanella sp.]